MLDTTVDIKNDVAYIRRGTALAVVTPSTKEDFDYINSHLRPMDAYEQNHFAKSTGMVDSLDVLEKAWTLRLRGDIVGYVGLQIASGQTALSQSRFIPMLSTVNVDKHWRDYVRLSRCVLAFVVSRSPEWVTDFYSLPMARYSASVRWHEKTMRWRRVLEFDLDGEQMILFHLNRQEVTKWQQR